MSNPREKYDETISVWFHRAGASGGSISVTIAAAQSVQHAKRIARADAKETQRPLRCYGYTKTTIESGSLFPSDTIERPSKL